MSRSAPFEEHRGGPRPLGIYRSRRNGQAPQTDCGQVGDKEAGIQDVHLLDAQALVGQNVEGRIVGGRCVLGGPDEAVGAVEDHCKLSRGPRTSVRVGPWLQTDAEGGQQCEQEGPGWKPLVNRATVCGTLGALLWVGPEILR